MSTGKDDIDGNTSNGTRVQILGVDYEEILKVFLESVIRDAAAHAEQANRKAITALDVTYATRKCRATGGTVPVASDTEPKASTDSKTTGEHREENGLVGNYVKQQEPEEVSSPETDGENSSFTKGVGDLLQESSEYARSHDRTSSTSSDARGKWPKDYWLCKSDDDEV